MTTCQWTNFDDLLDDPKATAEHCGKEALWISCEPFIGCLTCEDHKCRCAKRIQQEAKCSPPDLKPYRSRPNEIRRMVASREVPATFLPPMILSTGAVMPMGEFSMQFSHSAKDPDVRQAVREGVREGLAPLKHVTDAMEAVARKSGDVVRKLRKGKKEPRPDMSFHIALPAGWKFYGILPTLEPEQLFLTEEGSFDLTQDVCSIFSPPDPTAFFHPSEDFEGPAARFTIDVGWYPDGDPKGHYHCVVMTTDGLDQERWEDHQGNPWAQAPIIDMETKSTAAVWRWLSEMVSKIWGDYYKERG